MDREWGFPDHGMMFCGHDMKFHDHERGLKFQKWELHAQKRGDHDLGIEEGNRFSFS